MGAPVEIVLQGITVLLDLVEVMVASVHDVLANPPIGDFQVTVIQHRLSPLYLPGTIPPESPEDNGPIL
jgi:hypothetical protein